MKLVHTTVMLQVDNHDFTLHIRRNTAGSGWVAESDNFPGLSIKASTYEELMVKIHTEIPEKLP